VADNRISFPPLYTNIIIAQSYVSSSCPPNLSGIAGYFWKCLNSRDIRAVNFTSTDEAFVTELLAEMKYYNGDAESPQHIDQDRIQSCKIVETKHPHN
jgi:hypothetical protein